MTGNDYVQLARRIPVPEAVPTVSVNPVTLPVPDRSVPLELRVTAPLQGDAVPIVLLSHGGGSSHYLQSKDGFSPLVDFYAGHGLAVIQPTTSVPPAAGSAWTRTPPVTRCSGDRGSTTSRSSSTIWTPSRPRHRSSPDGSTRHASPSSVTPQAATPSARCSALGPPIRPAAPSSTFVTLASARVCYLPRPAAPRA